MKMFKPKKSQPTQSTKVEYEPEDEDEEVMRDLPEDSNQEESEIETLKAKLDKLKEEEAQLRAIPKKVVNQVKATESKVIKIVNELPVQEIRSEVLSNGVTVEYVTVSEALSELLTGYRKER